MHRSFEKPPRRVLGVRRIRRRSGGLLSLSFFLFHSLPERERVGERREWERGRGREENEEEGGGNEERGKEEREETE